MSVPGLEEIARAMRVRAKRIPEQKKLDTVTADSCGKLDTSKNGLGSDRIRPPTQCRSDQRLLRPSGDISAIWRRVEVVGTEVASGKPKPAYAGSVNNHQRH
jgi:hypothetical protein